MHLTRLVEHLRKQLGQTDHDEFEA